MRHSTHSPLRPVSHAEDSSPRVLVASRDDESTAPHARHHRFHRLSPVQCVAAFLVFLVWLLLFGAGIMVDTRPYRTMISPDGARQLALEGRPPEQGASNRTTSANAASPDPTRGPLTQEGVADSSTGGPPSQSETRTGELHDVRALAWAWLVVLFCFLPLNLAWLCVCASTLGGVGNMAQLGSDDSSELRRDMSNPILSAILRGFFVYLFLMSGLLLLDHAPFSNAGPSQYIRLAGFLSLFSFVVSYHPNLFGALIMSAFERIQIRTQQEPRDTPQTVHQRTEMKAVTIESTSAISESGEPGSGQRTSADAEDALLRDTVGGS